ncbi:MAG: hypothetical protein JST00_29710 [Deltaproteobacteria bacterium]|nr:hypothetical protein [Deltaproteobacteria bacterium]
MTGALQGAGGDGIERCAFCSADAAGPCASCKRSVCGDCCVLTDGGAQTWAICLDCDRRGGRSLSARWSGLGLWLVGLLVAMAALIALLEWVAPTKAP